MGVNGLWPYPASTTLFPKDGPGFATIPTRGDGFTKTHRSPDWSTRVGLTFEWDDGKASQNLTKHGVSFPEAATAFADPSSSTIHDPDHSDEEDRFILIGAIRGGQQRGGPGS